MFNDDQWMMLTLMCTMILLPIVPAYLLFRALPNTAEVTGPWQGLNIKLGGAFGGYFLVVLLIFSAYQQVKPKPEPPYDTWEVNGQIIDTDGKDIGPISAADFSAYPAWLDQAPGGGTNFHMVLFTRPGIGGTIYPTIYLRRNGGLASFSMDPNQQPPADCGRITPSKNSSHMVSVQIKEDCFKSLPAYAPTQAAVTLPAVPQAGGSQ